MKIPEFRDTVEMVLLLFAMILAAILLYHLFTGTPI